MQVNKYEHISKFYEMCLPGFWTPFKQLFEAKMPNLKFNLVDLGCGTGDAVHYLEDYIHFYKGVDHSPDMIEIAKHKFPSKDFVVGDILDYKDDNNIKYNIVLSAADTINHLLDKSYWDTFFDNAFDLLDMNGVFIFDMCTVNDHKNNWINYVDVIEQPDYTWIRKCSFNYENKLATTHNYFYILNTSNNLYSKEYDVINQISIETDEVIEMLKKHNFSNISVYDLHSGKEVDDQTSVATFFCRK